MELSLLHVKVRRRILYYTWNCQFLLVKVQGLHELVLLNLQFVVTLKVRHFDLHDDEAEDHAENKNR